MEKIAGILTTLTEVIQEQDARIKKLEGSSGQSTKEPEKAKEATKEELDAIVKGWRI